MAKRSTTTERFTSLATAKRPLTADDLFEIAIVSDPRPSPDGARVAYVVTRLDRDADDYRAAIWIAPIDGGEPIQLTSGAARDTSPRWSPDGTEIVFVSNRPSRPASNRNDASDARPPKSASADAKPKNQLWVIGVSGGEARQLTDRSTGASAPAWSPDGRTIAFLSKVDPNDDKADQDAPSSPVADERVITDIRYRFDGRGFIEDRFTHIWTIGAAGGEARQLTFGDFDDDQITWSPDGSRLAFISNRTPESSTNNISALYVVPVAGGDVRPLFEADAHVADPAWSPDGTRIAVIGTNDPAAGGARNANLWTVPVSGDEPTNYTATWDRAFGDAGMSDLYMAADQRPVWSDGDTIYALASDSGATNVYRVKLDRRHVTAVTGGARRIAGFALASERLVLLTGAPAQPFELATATIEGQRERFLTDHNRSFLDQVALAEPMELRATSPDGQAVQGWLLRPVGVGDDIKLPLIVQIHGGPHAMYSLAPFHELQLMAARGYCVLFSNPRGSAGYGEEFLSCTRANWGESDAPDILAILDAAIERGGIDDQRLGVTGGSYGGYLTNWIIGHSDRFRAAVTQRCVSNFYSMYGTSDIGFTFGEYEFGGTPWTDTDLLLKHSPISFVDKITTPLLIIHNEGDLRCPIEQAEQLFVFLKRLGREVTFVRIPEEDHNLSRTGKPSRRLARLHHLISWFDEHL